MIRAALVAALAMLCACGGKVERDHASGASVAGAWEVGEAGATGADSGKPCEVAAAAPTAFDCAGTCAGRFPGGEACAGAEPFGLDLGGERVVVFGSRIQVRIDAGACALLQVDPGSGAHVQDGTGATLGDCATIANPSAYFLIAAVTSPSSPPAWVRADEAELGAGGSCPLACPAD